MQAGEIQLGVLTVALGYRYLTHPMLRYLDIWGDIQPVPEWP